MAGMLRKLLNTQYTSYNARRKEITKYPAHNKKMIHNYPSYITSKVLNTLFIYLFLQYRLSQQDKNKPTGNNSVNNLTLFPTVIQNYLTTH